MYCGLPGVAGADEGARPSFLRCEGVRGMSSNSSLRAQSGESVKKRLIRRKARTACIA
jgi:hypothetical protein